MTDRKKQPHRGGIFGVSGMAMCKGVQFSYTPL
jgi:hypothetical protein